MEQLDMFDVIDEEPQTEKEPRFSLNQQVEVNTPKKQSTDIEDYYYLSEYAGKKGVIVKVNSGEKTSYTVDFGNKEGLFYGDDLKGSFE
ncbi:hypothetical protein [Cytobacillus sp. IB215665]|uniref:hypothetical protein n=1 Tax=Cytobacillus sp. IB215665 TaxID=3097357 RepID=UPI002A1866EC|nr:hypothetical protein [Cytobacillus sp. IB215665]MDX8367140.1 hypothetical protein [Cytobacillus sp. IB215665]